jgi:hypothetical protein
MLSTIKIVSGAEGTPWTDAQRACVMEVRSEHKLNDLTSFSILMHDIPDRRSDTERRLLDVGRKVAVLVRPDRDDNWTVLFQGKVTEIETHETQGVIGSTILYKGVDIRAVMAGRSFTGSWSGQVSDVIAQLIRLDFPDCVVDPPENNTLDATENPLAQNSNNLDFLRDQAVAVGFNFWVSYATVAEDAFGGVLDALDPRPPSVTITPTIHWGQSPYLAAKIGGPSLGGGAPTLPLLGGDDAAGPITFLVHVTGRACPNVTKFEVVTDGQQVAVMETAQPNTGLAGLIPDAGANPFASAGDADAPVVFFVPRVVRATPEDEAVNLALETARGFNRRVKLSTTLRRIKTICYPHDLAVLEGVAPALAEIQFRISEAVHVIRLDDHFMDLVLESDGDLPATDTTETLLEGALG